MAEKKSTEKAKAQVPEETSLDRVFAPLVDMRERLDDVLGSAFHGRWLPSWREDIMRMDPFGENRPLSKVRGDWIGVRFDVSESDDAYEITAELPGLDEDDVEIEVSEGVLTVKGEKREEEEKKGKDYYRAERRFGSFSRSFRLPEAVNEDKAKASFDKGVLEVVLPKKPEAKAKKKKIAVSKK